MIEEIIRQSCMEASCSEKCSYPSESCKYFCCDDVKLQLITLRITLKECVKYDATMEGPKFKSWNITLLNQLRDEVCETAGTTTT